MCSFSREWRVKRFGCVHLDSWGNPLNPRLTLKYWDFWIWLWSCYLQWKLKCGICTHLNAYLVLFVCNPFNRWGWGRPKPGSRSSVHIAHVGGRDPRTWTITYSLPRCLLPVSWNRSGGRTGLWTFILDGNNPRDKLTSFVSTFIHSLKIKSNFYDWVINRRWGEVFVLSHCSSYKWGDIDGNRGSEFCSPLVNW